MSDALLFFSSTYYKIFHPNVHFRTGDICLDILKKEWSPAWGLQPACRAVLALLSDPDAESPLNCDAGNMMRGGDILAYHTTAAMYTVENAQFTAWPPVVSHD
jgi:peroxin-4